MMNRRDILRSLLGAAAMLAVPLRSLCAKPLKDGYYTASWTTPSLGERWPLVEQCCTLNSQPFKGRPPHTVLMSSWACERDEQGMWHVAVSYTCNERFTGGPVVYNSAGESIGRFHRLYRETDLSNTLPRGVPLVWKGPLA